MDRSGHVVVVDAVNNKTVREYQIPAASPGAVSHGRSISWEQDSQHLWIVGGGWGNHLARWNTISGEVTLLSQQQTGEHSLHHVTCSRTANLVTMVRLPTGDRRSAPGFVNYCDVVIVETTTRDVWLVRSTSSKKSLYP